jgi:hypothetical protein
LFGLKTDAIANSQRSVRPEYLILSCRKAGNWLAFSVHRSFSVGGFFLPTGLRRLKPLATGRRQGLLFLGIKESLYVKGVSVQQQSKNLAAKKNFA